MKDLLTRLSILVTKDNFLSNTNNGVLKFKNECEAQWLKEFARLPQEARECSLEVNVLN
jgi:hypothetical protein